MSQRLAPGVYGSVTNLSQITNLAASSTFGVVIQAKRGPKGRYWATQPKATLSRYGEPASDDKALWTVLTTLKARGYVWVNNISHGDDTTAMLSISKTDIVQETAIFDPESHTFGANDLVLLYAAGPGPEYARYSARVSAVDPDKAQFTLLVYDQDRPNVPMETHVVSLVKKLTPGGNQTYIEDVLESRSSVIRAMVNPDYNGTDLPVPTVNPAVPADPGDPNAEPPIPPTDAIPETPRRVSFPTASLGSPVDAADVIRGYEEMVNVKEYNVPGIFTILDGGWSTTEIATALASVAERRGDGWAVASTPLTVLTPEQQEAYRATLPFTRWMSLYGPSWQLYSSYTGENVSLPASAAVGAVVAYNDFVKSIIWTPAGANRGKVPDALALDYDLNDGDMALLYPQSINSIVNQDDIGIVVWGARTLLQDDSVLWSVAPHRLLLSLMKSMASYLKYSLFDQNDSILWEAISLVLNQFLQRVKGARGLYWFKVVCDDSNNTGQTIDELEVNVDVYLQFVRDGEFINLNSVLMRTGASFEMTTSATPSF